LRSGSEHEGRQFLLGKAHALGQDDAEAVEQRRLSRIGLGYASQADLAMRRGRQHDVVRLDPRQLFENGTRRVSKAGALLPHLQAFPQHEGEEANEDVGLDPILALMPDRTNVQLVFLDTESSLSLCELDVSLPELLIAPVVMFERRR
jgi:hypothetical protein